MKVPMLGHREAWGSPSRGDAKAGHPLPWGKTWGRENRGQTGRFPIVGPNLGKSRTGGTLPTALQIMSFSTARLCDERPLPRISESACSLHARGLCYQFATTDPGSVLKSATNSLFQNILAVSPCGSGFCADSTLSPPPKFLRMRILDKGTKKIWGYPITPSSSETATRSGEAFRAPRPHLVRRPQVAYLP